MKIVIIEDEQASQAYLQNIITVHFPEMRIAAISDNVPDAVSKIKEHRPDIVFLDVEIKLGSGFNVLEQTKDLSFDVIFTTAFNTFAVEAFRHHAIDYLLKPLDTQHVLEATKRCVQRAERDGYNDQITKLLQHLQQPVSQKMKLSIPTLDGIEFIAFSDIIYGMAQGNYTEFRLKSGLKVMASRKLKDMEENLPRNLFFRIHHSYVVNLQYVKKYHKGRGGYVVLLDGTSLPVSSARKDEFLEWLG